MPALMAILLTASQIVLAADSVPRLDVERTCRPAAALVCLDVILRQNVEQFEARGTRPSTYACKG